MEQTGLPVAGLRAEVRQGTTWQGAGLLEGHSWVLGRAVARRWGWTTIPPSPLL